MNKIEIFENISAKKLMAVYVGINIIFHPIYIFLCIIPFIILKSLHINGGDFFSAIYTIILLLFLLLWLNISYFSKNKPSIKDFFPSSYSFKWVSVLGIFFILILGCLGLQILNSFIIKFIPIEITDPAILKMVEERVAHVPSTLEIIFYEIVTGIFLGPIFEELFFRGLIFHRLAIKWNISKAIAISSFIFAVVHPDPYYIHRSIFGIIACILYIKTNTLIVPIIFHILHNALMTFIKFFGTSENSYYYIVVVLPTIWTIYYLVKNWPKKGMHITILQ